MWYQVRAVTFFTPHLTTCSLIFILPDSISFFSSHLFFLHLLSSCLLSTSFLIIRYEEKRTDIIGIMSHQSHTLFRPHAMQSNIRWMLLPHYMHLCLISLHNPLISEHHLHPILSSYPSCTHPRSPIQSILPFISDDSMSCSTAVRGIKNQESKVQESSSGLSYGIIISEAHAHIQKAVSLYLQAISTHRASNTVSLSSSGLPLSDSALEHLQAASDRVTSLARTRRIDTDSCDAVIRLISVCDMMCHATREGRKEEGGGDGGESSEAEDSVRLRFRVAARDVLRSIASSSLLTDIDPTQRASEPSTCIDIALANCPHSLLYLSRSFTVTICVEEDSTAHVSHVRTAMQLLRTGINMWHQTNSFLNLELGLLLFQSLTDRSQKSSTVHCDVENREEEENVLEEACRSSSIAANGAAACLAVSISPAADDLSVQRKRERRVVLNVERAKVPALYQQCTELVYRLDCARENMSKTNDAGSSSSSTEAESECDGDVLSDAVLPSSTNQREGVESGCGSKIRSMTPCERSYRQYLRGVHWLPSLATCSLMK